MLRGHYFRIGGVGAAREELMAMMTDAGIATP